MAQIEPTIRQYKLVDSYDYVIPFGKKHKGETIGDVMVEDPQYLIWAHDNDEFLPWFELTGWLYDEIIERI